MHKALDKNQWETLFLSSKWTWNKVSSEMSLLQWSGNQLHWFNIRLSIYLEHLKACSVLVIVRGFYRNIFYHVFDQWIGPSNSPLQTDIIGKFKTEFIKYPSWTEQRKIREFFCVWVPSLGVGRILYLLGFLPWPCQIHSDQIHARLWVEFKHQKFKFSKILHIWWPKTEELNIKHTWILKLFPFISGYTPKCLSLENIWTTLDT